MLSTSSEWNLVCFLLYQVLLNLSLWKDSGQAEMKTLVFSKVQWFGLVWLIFILNYLWRVVITLKGFFNRNRLFRSGSGLASLWFYAMWHVACNLLRQCGSACLSDTWHTFFWWSKKEKADPQDVTEGKQRTQVGCLIFMLSLGSDVLEHFI